MYDYVNKISTKYFIFFDEFHYGYTKISNNIFSTCITILKSSIYCVSIEVKDILNIALYQLLMLKKSCTINIHNDKRNYVYKDEYIIKSNMNDGILYGNDNK